MAIDTAEKRKSASQTVTGLFGPGVTPNVSKDVEWRQQSGWGYSGILVAEAGSGFYDIAITSQQVIDVTVTIQQLTELTITFSW